MSLLDLGTTLADAYKESSVVIKRWVSAGVIISSLVGGAFWLDSYVAHASDIIKLEAGQMAINKKVEYSSDMQRKKYLDDKIFEYDQVPDAKRTQAERAINNRFKAERFEIIEKWKGQEPR